MVGMVAREGPNKIEAADISQVLETTGSTQLLQPPEVTVPLLVEPKYEDPIDPAYVTQRTNQISSVTIAEGNGDITRRQMLVK